MAETVASKFKIQNAKSQINYNVQNSKSKTVLYLKYLNFDIIGICDLGFEIYECYSPS
jgi:hypothetical protein